MTLDEKKRLNCKHPKMLIAKEEKLNANGRYSFKEIRVCPICGYKEDIGKAVRYPKPFKVKHPHPGGKEKYR